MVNIPENTEWVAELIPGLEARKVQFVVDTDDVDDELVGIFIEELRRLSGELKLGVESQDLEMVHMAAHSIKGMSGTIGLPEISVLGLDVETAAKEGRLADAEPLVQGLMVWIETLDEK